MLTFTLLRLSTTGNSRGKTKKGEEQNKAHSLNEKIKPIASTKK